MGREPPEALNWPPAESDTDAIEVYELKTTGLDLVEPRSAPAARAAGATLPTASPPGAAATGLRANTAVAAGVLLTLLAVSGDRATAPPSREPVFRPAAGPAMPPAARSDGPPGLDASAEPGRDPGTTPSGPSRDACDGGERVAEPRPVLSSGCRGPLATHATPARVPVRTLRALAIERVVPARPLAQALPRRVPAPFPLPRGTRARLSLHIDEHGRVTDAIVVGSGAAYYEAPLIAAARTWRYAPATRGGKPVKSSRIVEVRLR